MKPSLVSVTPCTPPRRFPPKAFSAASPLLLLLLLLSLLLMLLLFALLALVPVLVPSSDITLPVLGCGDIFGLLFTLLTLGETARRLKNVVSAKSSLRRLLLGRGDSIE